MALVTITGRLIQGDLYTANDKDADGNLRTIKTGPNAGKPKATYYIGVAVPKTQANWWSEPWGAAMMQQAQQDWPRGEPSQRTDFAWKVIDGDRPTVTGKTIDLAKGCWFFRLESSVQPGLWLLSGGAPVRCLEPEAIKRGYWVQVAFEYKGNGQATKPGMYANPVHVCLAGYDEEIISGPDVGACGFGAAALPSHVSATPVGGAAFAPAAAAMPQPMAAPAAMPQPMAAPAAMPQLPGVTAAPAAVVPNPAILAAPAPAPIVAPPAPAAEPRYNVQGTIYTKSQLVGAGYTDAHFATMQPV